MNKKKLLMFGLPLLAIGLVIAATVYFSSVNVISVLNEPLSSETVEIDLTAYAGESVTQNVLVENAADVTYDVVLNWIEKSNMVLMDNSEGTCANYPEPGWRDECEKRIELEGMLLSDFNSISWEADVLEGYMPHVDVKLDNGKSLTFEYATITETCNFPPYPDGEYTFNVDDTSYAWTNLPGPCGDTGFEAQHLTLADWKALYPTATITGIEIEVDNWISPSSSYLGNIKVNGDRIDSQLYGVSYSIYTLTQIAEPGPNDIEVAITYATDSPVGLLEGSIALNRA